MLKKFFRDHPVHKKIAPLFDEFFFFNPMNYYFSWLMICVGIYLNLFLSHLNLLFLFSFNFGYLLLFLGLSMILSSFYVLNKIYDVNERDENFFHIETKYSFAKFELLVKILIFVGLLLLLFVSMLNTIIGILLVNISFYLLKKYINHKFNEKQIMIFKSFFEYTLIFLIIYFILF